MVDGEPQAENTGDDAPGGRRVPLLPLAILATLGIVVALILWAGLSAKPAGTDLGPAVVVRLAPAPMPAAETARPAPPAPEAHGEQASAEPPATEHAAIEPPAAQSTAEADTSAPEHPAAEKPLPEEQAAHGAAETHAPEPQAHETPPAEASTHGTSTHGTQAHETDAAEASTETGHGHDAPPPAAPVTPVMPATPASSGSGLPPAPDQRLVEPGRDGLLPVIGPDGRQPWQVYARPFADRTLRPRIAIVVAGLGLRESTTLAAIETLPPDVTLAFTPYARDLPRWARAARAAGHEFLIQVPMEPVDFPTSDPGPKALMTGLSTTDNKSRLEWSLARATGYVGVMTYMGSRYTADGAVMRPTAEALRARGLMVLDSRTAGNSVIADVAAELGLPAAVATRFVDATPTRSAVDARLAELERFARQNGTAIGIAADYPGSIERIAAWCATLTEKGLVLAPVSALADTVTAPEPPPPE